MVWKMWKGNKKERRWNFKVSTNFIHKTLTYSKTDLLQKELNSMNASLTGCTKSNDLKIIDLNSRISKLEQAIAENTKDAKKLAKQIAKYVTDNLTTIYNVYDDYKYKKEIKDLNTSQISIFSDFKNFEYHDQAKIQDWFEHINSHYKGVFELERKKLLDEFEAELERYQKNDYLHNIDKINTIVSENKQQSTSYVYQVEKKLKSLKANAESWLQQQSEFRWVKLSSLLYL